MFKVFFCYDGDILEVSDKSHETFANATREMFKDIENTIRDIEDLDSNDRAKVTQFLHDNKESIISNFCTDYSGLHIDITETAGHIISDAFHCHWKVLKMS